MFFKKNISKLTDEELLQQYTDSGKTEYFGELYNRYIPLLYGLCLKYLSDEPLSPFEFLVCSLIASLDLILYANL